MIQALLNSRSPIVGISRPGQRPLVFKLDLIVRSLKGLTVTSERIKGDYLIVTAECLHVKAIRKYYGGNFTSCYNHQKMLKAISGWAIGERNKRARMTTKPTDRKQAARENKVAVLRTKLKKLTRRPRNPAVANTNNWGAYADSNNRNILRWYQQKPLRQDCRTKEDLGRLRLWDWQEHCPTFVMTKKPWELETIPDLKPDWGPERYSILKTEERATVKAQLAVLLEIPEHEVSAFTV